MPTPTEVTRAARERLARRERSELRRTEAAWRRIRANVVAEAQRLAEKAEAARAAGETVGEAWLQRQARYQQLLIEIEARLGELATNAPVASLQRSAIEDASDTVHSAVQAALNGGPAGARAAIMANWRTLPVSATEAMIGRTSAGAPLRTLLEEVAPGARRSAEDALRSGIARGQNPRIVARELAKITDTAYTRLETIARTESIGAQHEAARQSMQSHPAIVAQWRWTCAYSVRTCGGCIAQDGSLHPAAEIMSEHTRGRCGMTPVTRSWAELGFPDGRDLPAPEPARRWFEKLSKGDQDSILGVSKAEALRSGEIGWDDLVATRVSPVWGVSTSEASLRAARASALARV